MSGPIYRPTLTHEQIVDLASAAQARADYFRVLSERVGDEALSRQMADRAERLDALYQMLMRAPEEETS